MHAILQTSCWCMLFYCYFSACYFINVIWCILFYKRHFWCMLFYYFYFGASHFISVILMHLILFMLFWCMLFYKWHFRNCSLKIYISKIAPSKTAFQKFLSQKINYEICFFKTLYLFFIRIIIRKKIAQILINMSN